MYPPHAHPTTLPFLTSCPSHPYLDNPAHSLITMQPNPPESLATLNCPPKPRPTYLDI